MSANSFHGSAASLLLTLCLLLGGASGDGAGAVANGLLQLVSLVFSLVCLWSWGRAHTPPEARSVLLLAGFFVIVVLLSLAPLPASLWTSLPGREPIRAGLEMLSLADHALAISLAPDRTIASLMWFLPPVALFLLVLRSSMEARNRLPFVIGGVAVVSTLLGAAQLLGGGGSSLRFYAITNPNTPVGFFANTNHYATLVLCAIPFTGYLAARASSRISRERRSGGMVAALSAFFFLVVGIIISGSLAGYGLVFVSAAIALLVYRRATVGHLGKRWVVGLASILIIFLAFSMAGPLNTEAVGRKFSEQGGSSRKVMTATTLLAAKNHFPIGSGLGSFSEVYRAQEQKQFLTGSYVNHAHNDYAEILLELGAVAVILVLGFLIWWGRATLRVWRTDGEGGNLMRAASGVIGLVLVHSLVDYPLRTSAIAGLFAVACALLVPPAVAAKDSKRRDDGDAGSKHLIAD